VPTSRFNSSNIGENMDISANGTACTVPDVGNITMDLDGVETINMAAVGGADTVVTISPAPRHAGQHRPRCQQRGRWPADTVLVNGTSGDVTSPLPAGRQLSVHGLRRMW
jgi:hypothetical protein